MLNLTCHCGRIRLRLEKRPDYIHACNCTLCGKSGAHWGYFHPAEVAVEGASGFWSRTDKDAPNAEVHFCEACGVTTHFALTPGAIAKFGNSLLGVNMRLADERDLAGLELRFPDGRAWPGEGEFTYLREPLILGA